MVYREGTRRRGEGRELHGTGAANHLDIDEIVIPVLVNVGEATVATKLDTPTNAACIRKN